MCVHLSLLDTLAGTVLGLAGGACLGQDWDKAELGEGLEGESPVGFPGGGNHGAEKAVTGVLQQNWDETQNWNWGNSACLFSNDSQKEGRPGLGGKCRGTCRSRRRGKHYQNHVLKNLLSTKEKI